MKNKILIGVAILLILLVIVVRYQFKEKFKVFKTLVSQYEITQFENFEKEKEMKLSNLQSENPKIYKLFTTNFDEKASIQEKDTTYSFLYLSETIRFRIPVSSYISCLHNKCLIENENLLAVKLIASRVESLKRSYPRVFHFWYSKLKDDKLIVKTYSSDECWKIFTDLYRINYDENIWKDFEKLLGSYLSDMIGIEYENKSILNEFDRFKFNTLGQLKDNVIGYFNNNLSSRKSEILKTIVVTKTFDSKYIGSVQYTLEKMTFDTNIFQSVADDAFDEQWKTNSLYNGAVPYSYCYGSRNSCSDFNCSQIEVFPGSSDVLVTIKDSRGKVYRHAYIKAGDSFTFDVEDGEYQAYFYSGEGWNPNKFISQTSCGVIKGGFVNGESFTKAPQIMLYSQKMTYELILQQNGNLRTESSSKNEAFE